VQYEITQSTDVDLAVGDHAYVEYYLSKLDYFSNLPVNSSDAVDSTSVSTTSESGTVQYSTLGSADDHSFHQMQVLLLVAMVLTIAVAVLAVISCIPGKVRGLFAPSFCCFGIAVILSSALVLSLITLGYIGNLQTEIVEQSLDATLLGTTTAADAFPTYVCSDPTIEFQDYIFVAESSDALNCGVFWGTYYYTASTTEGETVVLQLKKSLGTGWWLTFAAVFTLVAALIIYGLKGNAMFQFQFYRHEDDIQDPNEGQPISKFWLLAHFSMSNLF
jgi:hypothetical protein